MHPTTPGIDVTHLDAIDKRLLGLELGSAYRRDRDSPAIFLLCTHEWGNIGDLAINYNEIALLERLFPRTRVWPISRGTLAANWQRVRDTITPLDLIAIHGGGNVGDVWPHEEAARLAVVAAFPQNRIISMPQSVHFDDEARLRASMDIYRGHHRFVFAARDERSAEIVARHLGSDRVVRTDDVVTRQVFPFAFRPRRDHVLFVERDDREKRDRSAIASVRDALPSDVDLEVTDSVRPMLPFSNVELAAKLVYQTIDEYHSAGVVVTDRLHGALFALIAGRPVVVFENSYGKIRPALERLLPALGSRMWFADGMSAAACADTIELARASPATALTPANVLVREHRAFDEVVQDFFRSGT